MVTIAREVADFHLRVGQRSLDHRFDVPRVHWHFEKSPDLRQ
jgi:hypothetical protein